MIIGFDTTHCGIADGSRGGVHQYIQQLLIHLVRAAPDLELRLFFALPHPRHRSTIQTFVNSIEASRLRVARSPLPERWMRPIGLPVETFTGRLDLFHGPYHILARSRAPAVLTVHDLAFMRDRGDEFAQPAVSEEERGRLAIRRRAMAEMADRLPQSIAAATRIIAVSQATADDLVSLADAPRERIRVIPNGLRNDVARIVDEAALGLVRRRYGLEQPHFLYIGALDPNKNLDRLIHGFAGYRQRGGRSELIAAGRSDWYGTVLRELTRSLGIADAVKFTGYVPDSDLSALYSIARCVLMPSPLEGFGLPALEAMACGTPVVAVDAGALPEVVGDCGLLVDPLDADAFTDALLQIDDDAALRERLAVDGPLRAARFSWDAAARQTYRVYEEVVHA